jgi:superfamily II DNA/RNA helicase
VSSPAPTLPANDSTSGVATDVPSFAELGLPPEIVGALARRGIHQPFPIQAATLVDALAGSDVLGRGRTGSGKTLAFGLPTLARLAGGRAQAKRPRALVLVPTRELATQVHDALEPLAHSIGLKVRPIIGGASFPKQREALQRGVDVIVATPGRLTDLVEQGACKLDQVEIVVLDEADHMADMGFMPAVTALLDLVPRGGQHLLFSATLDGEVDKLVRRYLNSPVTHSVDDATGSHATMEHHVLVVRPEDKLALTAEIANREGRTILFVRTKHGADRLATQLTRQGVPAAALHGGKTQGARTRTLADFREGRVPALVATDVAARGIHVNDVGLVVHVDPPADPKDYLHRAGRTARAGDSGVVVTLVLPKQQREVDAMARRAGVELERLRVRSGDAEVARLTGARTPSGVPVVLKPHTSSNPSGNKPPYSGARRGAPRSGAPRSGAPRSGGPRSGSPRSEGSGTSQHRRPAGKPAAAQDGAKRARPARRRAS